MSDSFLFKTIDTNRGIPAGRPMRSPSHAEVLDMQGLCERCLGNLDLVQRVLDKFEQRLPGNWPSWSASWRTGMPPDAQVAHCIKGNSSNISAAGLQQSAAEIEEFESCGPGGGHSSLPAELARAMAAVCRLPCGALAMPIGAAEAWRRARLPHGDGLRGGLVKILIVDDDDVAVEILGHALAQFGYQVTVARNGREALDLVRSGQFRMVVSDWEMPKMTGLELCREIRRCSATGYVYVILLTSRQGTQNVVDGMNAGADDFVNKPFQPQELLVRIRAGQRILSLESRELIIFSLAKLAESRDPETGTHLERMREYCRVIAEHFRNRAPSTNKWTAITCNSST